MITLPKNLVAVSVSILLFITAGCAGGMEGVPWKLAGWPVSSLNAADYPITARCEGGRFFGNTGLNTYGGPCTIGPEDAFSVWPINVGGMIGDSRAMSAEAAYLSQLAQARSFSVTDGRLMFYDQNKKEVLVFEATGR